MARAVRVTGALFTLRTAPCAHICRYCSLTGSRQQSPVPFERFEPILNRFLDWKRDALRDDFDLTFFVGPSFDYDVPTLQGVRRLRQRVWQQPFEILNLGG